VTGDGWGRVNGILAVSRSLGDFYMAPWVVPTPNITSIDITVRCLSSLSYEFNNNNNKKKNTNFSQQDSKYLIIACDGVWDEIEDDKASSIVDELVGQNKLDEAAVLLRFVSPKCLLFLAKKKTPLLRFVGTLPILLVVMTTFQ